MDMNELHLTGRLVKDVELRSTASVSTFVWFALAVHGKKDKSGNTPTDFISCQMWGKQAELLAKFGQKGKRIMVGRGCLKTYTKMDDSTGEKHVYTYVYINSFDFLDPLKQKDEGGYFEDMGEVIEF